MGNMSIIKDWSNKLDSDLSLLTQAQINQLLFGYKNQVNLEITGTSLPIRLKDNHTIFSFDVTNLDSLAIAFDEAKIEDDENYTFELIINHNSTNECELVFGGVMKWMNDYILTTLDQARKYYFCVRKEKGADYWIINYQGYATAQ